MAEVSAQAPLLRGTALTKRYGGVVALDGVDIEVQAGQILGLVGPNGAGKTTLVDLITGAQSATEGTVELLGRPLSGSAAHRGRAGLARTFQHPLLAPDLTVAEVLVSGLVAKSMGSTWGMITALVRGSITSSGPMYGQAAELAAELGIDGLDRLCGSLSLGEQRLLEVGRALAQDPLLMLLDEPFAGADVVGVAGVIEAIRMVSRRGHGVVLVDHNVDLIASLADDVLLLDRGSVVFRGTPAKCLASQQMRDVYFGGEVPR